ncbi:ABC transporter ATP-binding protein [Marinomonas mediterranea]|jgi:carbohydrate ABC transporter ATP-binding protein, CUT1 family (TC 3.A.1.1.-)|uniref:Glycerol-3-phosphate-transporting ATPase n=1 Tax=Marinomonas mediterranea (strain ATCC 700492 / JCM 21426 / NBRC 103028 / MMB-1) TaxID=717774 RepID=F2K0J0_MARM1|nr:sn-glycerol-3-phosphate ABC transporter ATP-binding protein UgpC [Marinomonas mediterranea]ADZ90974.1 Glycerol-3-phosphate-transporting ATPase [Marinomonas mediterranea MMB-1]WCN09014.1 sn-glycerol-3-phosphate ABC transporter ATP-binding protein UgpC [Marinomonas mediterranea]WCN13048.1 sn-glycerol-3-phosphate ABC transporter ATP-binding protein UgpC [Marinomonas mediterranea]WCN17117.1 sn-glycerol-3-phosphate ABC transporter ATP-binding protein UgpC [Marinomonas mediterranea MMB-1]
MSSVILRNVNKSYGTLPIVKSLNLEVQDGEFVVLVGPSGCGKSTTLRMVAGLEDITQGDIHVGGRPVNDLPPHKRNIAMVFQNYALYPHMSVRENIVFGLKKSGADAQTIQNKLADVSEMLKLEPYLDRKPADLSGGQRQRVAMGRALARDADVYLFDEPLSNLDAKLRHHMRTEIARIQHLYNMTAIYVTHDQIEAMTLGDRVVVMRDGIVEQVGSPMEIYLQPTNTFVATFIGSPAMNLIEASVKGSDLLIDQYRIPASKVANIDLETLAKHESVLVGIRPDFFEDSSLTTPSDNVFEFDNIHIDLVENLGFDKEILFKLGGEDAKARLDLRSNNQRHDHISLTVDFNRVLLFDTSIEGVLLNPGEIEKSDD